MSPKILIVDDEETIRGLLTLRLSQCGFEVLAARDTREFRERIFNQKPDVIILNIMLGNENGVLFYEESIKPYLDRIKFP